MKFKKGDVVEVWGDDENFFTKAEYFAFNDHPEVEYDDENFFTKAEYFAFNDHPEVEYIEYPHLVRLYREDGSTTPNIYCYSNCRHIRLDLKMDDLVWVRLLPPPKSLKMAVDKHGYCWMPRHFAGWDNGYMKYWKGGCTSHTVPDENAYHTSLKYRTSPPDIYATA